MYQGNLVRLVLKPGTMEQLMEIAGRGGNMINDYPNLLPEIPSLPEAWLSSNAQVKLEGVGNPFINSKQGVVNTLLGTGKGVEIVNNGILDAQFLSKKFDMSKKYFSKSDMNNF